MQIWWNPLHAGLAASCCLQRAVNAAAKKLDDAGLMMQPEDGMEDVSLSNAPSEPPEDGWDADNVGWAAEEGPEAHSAPTAPPRKGLSRPSSDPSQPGPDLEAENAGLQARLKAVEAVSIAVLLQTCSTS